MMRSPAYTKALEKQANENNSRRFSLNPERQNGTFLPLHNRNKSMGVVVDINLRIKHFLWVGEVAIRARNINLARDNYLLANNHLQDLIRQLQEQSNGSINQLTNDKLQRMMLGYKLQLYSARVMYVKVASYLLDISITHYIKSSLFEIPMVLNELCIDPITKRCFQEVLSMTEKNLVGVLYLSLYTNKLDVAVQLLEIYFQYFDNNHKINNEFTFAILDIINQWFSYTITNFNEFEISMRDYGLNLLAKMDDIIKKQIRRSEQDNSTFDADTYSKSIKYLFTEYSNFNPLIEILFQDNPAIYKEKIPAILQKYLDYHYDQAYILKEDETYIQGVKKEIRELKIRIEALESGGRLPQVIVKLREETSEKYVVENNNTSRSFNITPDDVMHFPPKYDFSETGSIEDLAENAYALMEMVMYYDATVESDAQYVYAQEVISQNNRLISKLNSSENKLVFEEIDKNIGFVSHLSDKVLIIQKNINAYLEKLETQKKLAKKADEDAFKIACELMQEEDELNRRKKENKHRKEHKKYSKKDVKRLKNKERLLASGLNKKLEDVQSKKLSEQGHVANKYLGLLAEARSFYKDSRFKFGKKLFEEANREARKFFGDNTLLASVLPAWVESGVGVANCGHKIANRFILAGNMNEAGDNLIYVRDYLNLMYTDLVSNYSVYSEILAIEEYKNLLEQKIIEVEISIATVPKKGIVNSLLALEHVENLAKNGIQNIPLKKDEVKYPLELGKIYIEKVMLLQRQTKNLFNRRAHAITLAHTKLKYAYKYCDEALKLIPVSEHELLIYAIDIIKDELIFSMQEIQKEIDRRIAEAKRLQYLRKQDWWKQNKKGYSQPKQDTLESQIYLGQLESLTQAKDELGRLYHNSCNLVQGMSLQTPDKGNASGGAPHLSPIDFKPV